MRKEMLLYVCVAGVALAACSGSSEKGIDWEKMH